jgi:hypothetical protein
LCRFGLQEPAPATAPVFRIAPDQPTRGADRERGDAGRRIMGRGWTGNEERLA